jgi:hypothetical protein
MPGINYEIKTAADLRALRSVEDSLRQQVMVAKAAGKDFSVLKAQLDSVSSSIRSIPAPKKFGLEMAGMVQSLPIVGNFASALNGLGGPITLAIGGLTALAKGAARAIGEFAGAEVKMAKLDAVLAQQGQLTDAYRQKLQGLASDLQAATAIADDQWLDVLSRLSQFGADSSNIEDYAEAVKNLAGITGGDIVSAAEMFSKAMSGQFEMFGRLGIRIEKTGTQTEQLNALMLQLAQKGGGVLEAQSKTLTGQWQQLTNSVSDLFEAIGNLISRTRILQAVTWALTGTVQALQNLFPSLIPRLQGLENKFQTAAERAETLREKLRDQAPDTRRAYEAFGEAGRALDALNDSLDTAASKADQARKQMLDLAEATAEAAKAKVALDLANGRISPEQAAEANRKINAEVSAARLQAARAEQQAIRDAALARIAEVQAAEAKAQADVQKLGPAPDDADLASNEEQLAQQQKELAAAKALRDSFTNTPQTGLAAAEYGAPLALEPTPQQKEDNAIRIRNAERTIAGLEAQREKMLAARDAADELVKAKEAAARVIPEQQAIADRATAAMKPLDLREQAAADQAAADAAASKTAQDKAQAEAAHKSRILDLQIAINEARQRGDEKAADRAQQLMDWLMEYKRVWEETGDDAKARRAANAKQNNQDQVTPERATTRPTADRLAQIGLFVGSARPDSERYAQDTARHTAATAKNTEKLLTRAFNPTPGGTFQEA